MRYALNTPCDECPFLKGSGFAFKRLKEFASNQFACHKACKVNDESEFVPRSDKTPHCAGALIFNEKRGEPHQMMRIAERLGLYDRSKLDMSANVGESPSDFRRSKP